MSCVIFTADSNDARRLEAPSPSISSSALHGDGDGDGDSDGDGDGDGDGDYLAKWSRGERDGQSMQYLSS